MASVAVYKSEVRTRCTAERKENSNRQWKPSKNAKKLLHQITNKERAVRNLRYSGSPLSRYMARIAGLGLPKLPNQWS